MALNWSTIKRFCSWSWGTPGQILFYVSGQGRAHDYWIVEDTFTRK